MGTTKCSKENMLFNSLVNLLKNQQQQLQTLLQERKILEDRIKTQHERWASDIRLYEDFVSQMKDALVEKDKACLVEAAKSDLMIGLKNRESSLCKLILEQTEDELADFRAGFDCLSHFLDQHLSETENGKEGVGHRDLKSSSSKWLGNEVKRLKLDYGKLASRKNSEISALLKEKSFVWHQYNVLESNLTDKLKNKQAEVDLANEKIAKVIASMELLKSSNNDKDEMIRQLKAKLDEVEADGEKWKEEISRLSQESESLRKSRSAQVTPDAKHGEKRTKASSWVVKCGGRKGSNVVATKELTPGEAGAHSNNTAKNSRSLKRKGVEVTAILETPKLFTNSFKVPKLKTSYSPVT